MRRAGCVTLFSSTVRLSNYFYNSQNLTHFFPQQTRRPHPPPRNIYNHQDIVCPEAVKIDDLDPAAVTANFEAAKSKAASAEAGSYDAAIATIEVEVNKAMGSALGLSLA